MTIKEMAAELGVATSTISRVLNGCNRNFSVKPELRRKILVFAAQSGYQPNPIFQSMRAADNHQIAVLFPDRPIERAGHVLEAALDAATETLESEGYSLHYLSGGSRVGRPYTLPLWKVAGLLIADPVHPARFSLLEEKRQPYVALNGVSGPEGTAVTSDESVNMRLVMNHLFDLGHREIAYLNHWKNTNPHPTERERQQQYEAYCKERELPIRTAIPQTEEELDSVIRLLLKQRVSSIVTYSELYANRILYFAWREGIRIPRDLSIVTFNELDGNHYTLPPLTSLAIPERKIGGKAAELVLEKIQNPDFARGETIRFAGNLIVRESSGPALHGLSGNH